MRRSPFLCSYRPFFLPSDSTPERAPRLRRDDTMPSPRRGVLRSPGALYFGHELIERFVLAPAIENDAQLRRVGRIQSCDFLSEGGHGDFSLGGACTPNSMGAVFLRTSPVVRLVREKHF